MAAILAVFLEKEDYGALGNQTRDWLNSLENQKASKFDRAVAAFCAPFGAGYAEWQGNYDYPRIHEYFYGAYLCAEHELGEGSDSDVAKIVFSEFSESLLEYTNCENALITNNASLWLESATKAWRHTTLAVNTLKRLKDDEQGMSNFFGTITETLKSYLTTNQLLFCGLMICGAVNLKAHAHDSADKNHDDKDVFTDSLLRDLSKPEREAFKWWLKEFIRVETGRDKRPAHLSRSEAMRCLLFRLRHDSAELYSEVRAYYSLARRYEAQYGENKPRLNMVDGIIYLRAIGYAGKNFVDVILPENDERLREALRDFNPGSTTFKDLIDSYRVACKSSPRGTISGDTAATAETPATADKEEPLERYHNALQDYLEEKIGWKVDVRLGPQEDMFDTVLGKDYLQYVIIDFSDAEKLPAFTLQDGPLLHEYQAMSLHLTVTRFGAISVEFAVPVSRDKFNTISHVRVLESLIGPHAGRLEIVWQPGEVRRPNQVEQDIPVPPQPSGAKARPWFHRFWGKTPPGEYLSTSISPEDTAPSELDRLIKYSTANYVTLYKECCSWAAQKENAALSAELRETLASWKTALRELAPHVSYRFVGNKLAKDAEEQYKALAECMQVARGIIPSATRAITPDTRLTPFHDGQSYLQLMDIAHDILDRISQALGGYILKNRDIRDKFEIDPNTGWQAIVMCNDLCLTNCGPETFVAPLNEQEADTITDHFEFKGLLIENREARSGLDDWLYVRKESKDEDNLALIRSHEHDWLVMGENRAFVYLTDEPRFLVDQFIDTIRFVGNLRTLVLTFNRTVRDYTTRMHEASQQSTEHLSEKWREETEQQRAQIEELALQAENVLDLVRSSAISKYEDHSRLVAKMIEKSNIDKPGKALEYNVATLRQYQAYLTARLEERSRRRTEKIQARIQTIATFFTIFAGVGVLLSAYSPLIDWAPLNNGWLAIMNGPQNVAQNGQIEAYKPYYASSIIAICILLAAAVIATFAWIELRNLRKNEP